MQEKCNKIDNLNECMARYAPKFIFEKAQDIFQKSQKLKII